MVPRVGAGAAWAVLVLELAQGSPAWALARCEAALAACESCPATGGPEPVEGLGPWRPVIALLATQLAQAVAAGCAVAGCLREARLGERVRVAYVDDDVDHERMLVWPVSEALWYVMSPDRDVWVEDLTAADHATGPCRCWPLAGGVQRTAPQRLHGFKELPDADGLGAQMTECRRTASLELGFVERPLPTEAEVGGAFHVLDCRAGGVSGTLAPRVRGVWMLCEPLGRAKIGQVIELTELDHAWGDQALIKGSDGHGRARLVDPSDVGALAEGRRQLLRDALELQAIAAAGAGEAASWRSDRAPALLASSRAAPSKAIAAIEDARTQWIDVGAHGGRVQTRRDVARESSTEECDDTPLEGPRAALHLLKRMGQFGVNPKSWLEKWCLERRVGKSDRPLHGLETLGEALMIGGSFEQLNMPSLVSFEKICRRAQLIIDARAEPGTAPLWRMARYFNGVATLADA
ncbi:unnamed protein product, partial [Prorocentrum cordatum]